MKCDFEKLSAYFDGLLPDPERAGLEKHLKTCEACAAGLEELVRLEMAVKKIPAPQLSEAYWENFADRVQNKIAIRGKQRMVSNWLENLRIFFQPTTGKLAIAGSLATILLVAIIGQDYWKKEVYQPPLLEKKEIQGVVGRNDTLQGKDLPEKKERQVGADKRTFAVGSRRDEPAPEKQTRENEQKGLLTPPASAVASKPAEEGVFRKALKDEKADELDLAEGRAQNEPVGEIAPTVAVESLPDDTVVVMAGEKKVSAEKVEKLPIRNVDDLVKLQAGISSQESQIHVRDSQKAFEGLQFEKIKTAASIKDSTDDSLKLRLRTIEYLSKLQRGVSVDGRSFDAIKAISNTRQIIAEQEKQLKGSTIQSIVESLQVSLSNQYFQLYLLSQSPRDLKKADKRLDEFLKTNPSEATRQYLATFKAELKRLKK